jgi:ketol-acid reductoisomerase
VTEQRIFSQGDLDTSALKGKRIGIVGYGSQGRAQALNLRDSGFPPTIGVRAGRSSERARSDGFEPVEIAEAAAQSDIIVVLTPDENHAEILSSQVIPNVERGVLFGFAAGFTVHFGLVKIPRPHKAFLVAPKGPGRILRRRFLEGGGIPALVATVDQDPEAMALALAYASAVGCARAGVIKTTFREEAVADLFGEQCVLAGGMIELMRAAFKVLVDRGYTPEVAYIECISEVEYMASLISRVGLTGLAEHISSTAWYGGETRGRRIVDDAVRAKLIAILDEIESGKFFSEFRARLESGALLAERREDSDVLDRAKSGLDRMVPDGE